jgi:hypothetical protein
LKHLLEVLLHPPVQIAGSSNQWAIFAIAKQIVDNLLPLNMNSFRSNVGFRT